MIKLSVIIPTYNRSDMVVDAIGSLCQQDMSADIFEIIVVDNNSKDNTTKKVEQAIANYPNHHIRYVLETRQGDFFARNRGADEAVGQYLVFSDDDALFDRNYLSTIYRLFELYPQVGVVGTRIIIKWEGGKPAYWIKPYEHLLGAISYVPNGYIIKSRGLYINNGSLAVKRDLYISVGGINPAQVGDYIIGDAEGGFCRKIHQLGIPMGFTDDVAMHHRQIVGKNDTVADIRRRVENIGITNAYTDVIVRGKPKPRDTRATHRLMIWYRLTHRYRKYLTQYFRYCQDTKYNEYIDRYQHDENLKALLQANHYEFKSV